MSLRKNAFCDGCNLSNRTFIRYISRQKAESKGTKMKLDRDKLNELVNLPDEELWKKVIEIGKSHGFILPERTPEHSELEKLRSIARDGAKMNVANALRILSKYRG